MTAIIAVINAFAAPALVVDEMPDDVSGFGNSGVSANITTGLVATSVTGGRSPYTYAWTQLTSSPYTWVITSPTAATTSFTCNSLGPGTTAEVTFKCTVTDAAGTKATGTVTAFANNGQPYDDRISSDKVDRFA